MEHVLVIEIQIMLGHRKSLTPDHSFPSTMWIIVVILFSFENCEFTFLVLEERDQFPISVCLSCRIESSLHGIYRKQSNNLMPVEGGVGRQSIIYEDVSLNEKNWKHRKKCYR